MTQLNSQMRDPLTFLLNPPVFRAERAAAWTIAAGHQDVPWDTIVEDTYTGWAAGTPTRYTAQAPGWYLVAGEVSLSGTGAAGQVLIPSAAVNGTSPTGQGATGWEGPEIFVPPGTGPKAACGLWEVYCNVGDYIELDLWYSSESGITAIDTTATYRPRIGITWMGV